MMNIDFVSSLAKFRQRPSSPLLSLNKEKYAAWQLGLPFAPDCNNSTDMPMLIAVGGGKGGVGKSVVSSNLAASLGNLGRRVVVIDMDLGGANLHTHFGMSMPKVTLADFVVKKSCSLQDAVQSTVLSRVGLIGGGREEEWGGWIAGSQDLSGVWRSLPRLRTELGAEFVIFDLGAGTSKFTMEFFAAANVGIVTVLPEPTSIENAYVFIKTALWKLIDNIGTRLGEEEVAQAVLSTLAQNTPRVSSGGYLECFRKLYGDHPHFISSMVALLKSRTVGIVVNQIRENADIDIGRSMEHLCGRFFGFETKYLGYLSYDESVWKSLKNRKMLMQDFPHSPVVRKMGALTSEILSQLQESR